jgi:hypothetical protein
MTWAQSPYLSHPPARVDGASGGTRKLAQHLASRHVLKLHISIMISIGRNCLAFFDAPLLTARPASVAACPLTC